MFFHPFHLTLSLISAWKNTHGHWLDSSQHRSEMSNMKQTSPGQFYLKIQIKNPIQSATSTDHRKGSRSCSSRNERYNNSANKQNAKDVSDHSGRGSSSLCSSIVTVSSSSRVFFTHTNYILNFIHQGMTEWTEKTKCSAPIVRGQKDKCRLWWSKVIR